MLSSPVTTYVTQSIKEMFIYTPSKVSISTPTMTHAGIQAHTLTKRGLYDDWFYIIFKSILPDMWGTGAFNDNHTI